MPIRFASSVALALQLAGVTILAAGLATCSGVEDEGTGSTASSSTGASGAGGAGSGSGGGSTVGSAGAGTAGSSSSVGAGGSGGTSFVGTGGTTSTGGSGGAGTGGVGGGAGGATSDAGSDATTSSDGAMRDAVSNEVGPLPEAGGPFALTSTAFREGETIPLTYKCSVSTPAGQNLSPPLSWTPGPTATKSYAVTFIHDAPDMSIHWVIWDIPLATTSLPENVEKVAEPSVPAGSKQVRPNIDGSTWYGYQGPCPMGSRQNYQYAVYAIDVDTLPGVTTQSSSAAAMGAVRAHQVVRAVLSGTQLRQ